MQWLNYHHLLYFWTVARTGSIVEASQELMLAPPTISSQIRDLEEQLNCKLFQRKGRHLVLTDVGERAFSYANEIFSLGRELLDAMERRPAQRPLKLAVGILDVLPKSVVRLLLEPAMQLPQPVRLSCQEDKADRLLADLAARRTDMVLSDAPIGTGVQLRGFNHLLGECGITFFGTAALADKRRRGFPRSLEGAPVLLPTEGTALRHELNLWFAAQRIHPTVVVECDDGALLTSFGQAGMGIFAAPSVVEAEVRREHKVRVVGRTDQVKMRFYAISVQEKLKHPAVLAIWEAARREIFQ